MADNYYGQEDYIISQFLEPNYKLYNTRYGHSFFDLLCSSFIVKARKARDDFMSRHQREDRVFIGIADKLDFNASISKRGDTYYITIPIGSLISVFNLLCFIYGSRTKAGSFKFSDDGRPNLCSDGIILIAPSDLESKKSISWLWHQCVMFLFFHEFAHYSNGHLDFQVQKYGEGCPPIPRPERLLDRHTLEFDADHAATRSCFEASLNNNMGALLSKKISDIFASIYGFDLYPLNVAVPSCGHIVLLFQIFDVDWSFSNVLDKHYPSPALRISHCLGLCTQLAVEQQMDYNLYGEAVAYLRLGMIDLISRLFGYIPPSKTDPMKVHSEDAVLYLEKILKNWALIRPQLDSLKKGGSLAPSQY